MIPMSLSAENFLFSGTPAVLGVVKEGTGHPQKRNCSSSPSCGPLLSPWWPSEQAQEGYLAPAHSGPQSVTQQQPELQAQPVSHPCALPRCRFNISSVYTRRKRRAAMSPSTQPGAGRVQTARHWAKQTAHQEDSRPSLTFSSELETLGRGRA